MLETCFDWIRNRTLLIIVAVKRYTQIIEDTDAWQPAYEDLGDKDYIVPTRSSERLSDLLEIITGMIHCVGGTR